MFEQLEHHEHAEHLAHGHGEHGEKPHGDSDHAAQAKHGQIAALVVAILAALLAITEQGAKHAEIRVEQAAIAAADSWAQYQAKSTRGSFAADLVDLIGALDTSDTAAMRRRSAVVEKLKKDEERYTSDPKDGKRAIARRARAFEEARDVALEQTHAYHNGTAALELGIVLTTASAIIKSRMLIIMALGFGAAGAILALLGLIAPEYGAF
jgi:Domain of unknown function (DUF4337)